ncbi:MAG: hypothetical protein MI784_11175 [Cytophagales bacterium]|nr:hypothetical protein [Cytophagales bacterium]
MMKAQELRRRMLPACSSAAEKALSEVHAQLERLEHFQSEHRKMQRDRWKGFDQSFEENFLQQMQCLRAIEGLVCKAIKDVPLLGEQEHMEEEHRLLLELINQLPSAWSDLYLSDVGFGFPDNQKRGNVLQNPLLEAIPNDMRWLGFRSGGNIEIKDRDGDAEGKRFVAGASLLKGMLWRMASTAAGTRLLAELNETLAENGVKLLVYPSSEAFSPQSFADAFDRINTMLSRPKKDHYAFSFPVVGDDSDVFARIGTLQSSELYSPEPRYLRFALMLREVRQALCTPCHPEDVHGQFAFLRDLRREAGLPPLEQFGLETSWLKTGSSQPEKKDAPSFQTAVRSDYVKLQDEKKEKRISSHPHPQDFSQDPFSEPADFYAKASLSSEQKGYFVLSKMSVEEGLSFLEKRNILSSESPPIRAFANKLSLQLALLLAGVCSGFRLPAEFYREKMLARKSVELMRDKFGKASSIVLSDSGMLHKTADSEAQALFGQPAAGSERMQAPPGRLPVLKEKNVALNFFIVKSHGFPLQFDNEELLLSAFYPSITEFQKEKKQWYEQAQSAANYLKDKEFVRVVLSPVQEPQKPGNDQSQYFQQPMIASSPTAGNFLGSQAVMVRPADLNGFLVHQEGKKAKLFHKYVFNGHPENLTAFERELSELCHASAEKIRKDEGILTVQSPIPTSNLLALSVHLALIAAQKRKAYFNDSGDQTIKRWVRKGVEIYNANRKQNHPVLWTDPQMVRSWVAIDQGWSAMRLFKQKTDSFFFNESELAELFGYPNLSKTGFASIRDKKTGMHVSVDIFYFTIRKNRLAWLPCGEEIFGFYSDAGEVFGEMQKDLFQRAQFIADHLGPFCRVVVTFKLASEAQPFFEYDEGAAEVEG